MKRIEGRVRGVDGRRLYWVWAAMVQRCHNHRNPAFRNYGAKGIVVCARWRDSFDAFAQDMGMPARGMSIERRDSTAGYNPDNCLWIPRSEQNKNRPSWCRYVWLGDERMTAKDAWRRLSPADVSYRAAIKRMGRGWSIGQALVAGATRA